MPYTASVMLRLSSGATLAMFLLIAGKTQKTLLLIGKRMPQPVEDYALETLPEGLLPLLHGIVSPHPRTFQMRSPRRKTHCQNDLQSHEGISSISFCYNANRFIKDEEVHSQNR